MQCLTYFMLLFPFLFQISITTQVDIIKIYVFCTTWSKTNENMHGVEKDFNVETSKVRLIKGQNKLAKVQSWSDHTHKQTDYKRGDEGCFKGQNVWSLWPTRTQRCSPCNTAVGTLRVGPRGHEHTQTHRWLKQTKTEYPKWEVLLSSAEVTVYMASGPYQACQSFLRTV